MDRRTQEQPTDRAKGDGAAASPWTAEREARACRLYLEEGFSASQVAEALGCGLSRGAVIGKIRRLGLSKRPAPHRRANEAQPTRPSDRCVSPPLGMGLSWPPQPLPPLREAPLQGPPAALADLDPAACRWPLDDPGAERMYATLFCAAPAGDGVYCPAHRDLAAAPPPDGRRP